MQGGWLQTSKAISVEGENNLNKFQVAHLLSQGKWTTIVELDQCTWLRNSQWTVTNSSIFGSETSLKTRPTPHLVHSLQGDRVCSWLLYFSIKNTFFSRLFVHCCCYWWFARDEPAPTPELWLKLIDGAWCPLTPAPLPPDGCGAPKLLTFVVGWCWSDSYTISSFSI